VLGNGCLIRRGYAREDIWHTRHNPGWLHTAEDVCVPDGHAGGANVYAVADGEIVFAGSEGPGLVVVAQRADGLFSMDGHLDDALAVETGSVERG